MQDGGRPLNHNYLCNGCR